MGELASPVKVRGHHLLCMLGFRGLGYSPEFVVTMGKVVEALRTDAPIPMIVVTECDVICDSCPHKKDDKCQKNADSNQKVIAKDSAVLKHLGFDSRTKTTAGEALLRIKQRLSQKDMTEVCQNCEWFGLGYCVEGLAKLIKSQPDK